MDIIKAGMVLIVYLFIILITFFALSTPFNEFLDGMDDADTGAADPYIAVHIPWYRTVFNMFFAGMGIAPIVWFVVWTFQREPDWGYR